MRFRFVRPLSPPPRRGGYRSIPTSEVYVRFRLLDDAPLVVRFPSITYRIGWSVVRLTHSLQLTYDDGSGAFTFYSYDEGAPPPAHRAVWTVGIVAKRPSVLDTVFSRLVREGRAETIVGPHSPLVLIKPDGGLIY